MKLKIQVQIITNQNTLEMNKVYITCYKTNTSTYTKHEIILLLFILDVFKPLIIFIRLILLVSIVYSYLFSFGIQLLIQVFNIIITMRLSQDVSTNRL